MATLKYTGDKARVEWCGVKFELNMLVDLDMENPDHRHVLKKARGNPSFVVEDADIDDIEVVEVAPVVAEVIYDDSEDDAPTDYIPDDQAEKDAIRAELRALGVKAGGRSSLETLQQHLAEVKARTEV